MASTKRLTVTLPDALVVEVDRREESRSEFVAVAIRHEIDSRRRSELRRSLQNPHPESVALAEQGLEEWTRGLPEDDAMSILDISRGTPVRWIRGEGWVEGNTGKAVTP